MILYRLVFVKYTFSVLSIHIEQDKQPVKDKEKSLCNTFCNTLVPNVERKIGIKVCSACYFVLQVRQ